MLIFMYLIWAFIIYFVCYKAIVLKGKFSAEILAPSVVALVLSVGGIRPFVQSIAFIALYLFFTFFLFALDTKALDYNQN